MSTATSRLRTEGRTARTCSTWRPRAATRQNIPIIAVDMPEDAVGDPAGSTLSVQAAWGLIYILDRAEKLRNASANETLPVVVNLSYGPHEGPHDGTARARSVHGQLYAQLARMTSTHHWKSCSLRETSDRHAHTQRSSLQAAKRKTCDWRLQPGSLSASLMEIWLAAGRRPQRHRDAHAALHVAALPPIRVSPAKLDDAIPDARACGLLGDVRLQLTAPGTATRSCSASRELRPTRPERWGDAVAPSGVWRVTLSSTTAIPGSECVDQAIRYIVGPSRQGTSVVLRRSELPAIRPNGRPLRLRPGDLDQLREANAER